MFASILIAACALCAIGPAVLFCINLRRYRAPAEVAPEQTHALSVLIPARNEEANIGEALRRVLGSRGVELEVLVLDDASTDRTGAIVREIAAEDVRVRLVSGHGLPAGWNGKQHACWVLANESTQGLLVFLDADVRVEPELFARMAALREHTGAALVSGFPRLITVTWLEKLLLPLIHFVLLGFLPMRSMRRSTLPAFAAGCGQFMLVERETYFSSGGHAAIRETMHDGLLLPRALRRAGFRTDIADITALASVRMYDSAAKVWQGLAKNATEGIATAGKIAPLTMLLVLGQVLPALLAAVLALIFAIAALIQHLPDRLDLAIAQRSPHIGLPLVVLAHHGYVVNASYVLPLLLILAVVGAYAPRLLAVRRFRQPLGSALLHPIGIMVLLCVQWYALARKAFGKPVGWRERSYSSETGTEVG